MRARWIVVAVTASVVGCVPFSHNVTRVPGLAGDVTASGTPVVGAELLVTNSYRENPCREAIAIGNTHADGSFRLEQQVDHRRAYAPLVTPISISVYVLCISGSEGPVLGYRGIVSPDDSRALRLSCDLKRPYLLRGGDGFEGQAVCRLTNMGSNHRVESDALARLTLTR